MSSSASTAPGAFLRSVARTLARFLDDDGGSAVAGLDTEMMHAIFDNIPVMISVCDANDRFVSVNREWEKTLGWTLEEVQSRDVYREFYPDPADYAKMMAFRAEAARRWTDFHVRVRDGRTINASFIRFRLSDGSSIGLAIDRTAQDQHAKALTESQERFARIFQASPVALAMSTLVEGRMLNVNQTWLDLFGYRREDVIGCTTTELRIAVEGERLRSAVQQEIRATGAIRRLEVKLRTKSGAVIDAVVSAVPFSSPNGDEALISSITDITDTKRAAIEREMHLASEQSARAEAEQALEKLRAVYTITDSVNAHAALDDLLRELLGRLRRTLLVDYATVFLLNDDRKSLYVRAIDGIEGATLRPMRLPLGKGVSGLIASSGKPLIVSDYATIDLTGIDGVTAEELRAVNGSGAVMGVPLCIADKVVGVVVVTSTHPRLFSQEELKLLLLVADRVTPAIERGRLLEKIRAGRERQKALSRQLLTAQEEERRRLAVELHDELGQVLTAVKINLESLQRAPASLPTALDGMIASVDDALQRVRDIALDLRPSVLDDLGLPAALRWYADRMARGAGVEAHVSIDALPDIETGLSTACFRVAQEALTNVARHARAKHVWLDLHLLPDGLELCVRDDGVGFDVAAARERAMAGASVGLLGMQERASLAGGRFDLTNTPGGGAEVRALFPVGDRVAAS